MALSLITRAARAAVREPFFQFMVLGSLLFGAYTWLSQADSADLPPTEIRLTMDDLAQLVLGFEAQWSRSPTQAEFNQLVENRVREDVLYREALSLGLDKEDTIVKRRMAQKMEFLAEDLADAREPTDEELRSWFSENAAQFAVSPRLTFHHVYFSPDARGANAVGDAEAALGKIAGLPGTEGAAAAGDAFMFQDYYRELTTQAIARDFGPEFAVAVARLDPGHWQGPVRSGYGWHLVFVDGVIPGRVPNYEEVAGEVKTAWLGTRKAEAWTKAYDEIRAKYDVLMPVPVDAASAAATEAADAAGSGQQGVAVSQDQDGS